MAPFSTTSKHQNNTGTGYGGERHDEHSRRAGKKAASQRETLAWKEWQKALQTLVQEHTNPNWNTTNHQKKRATIENQSIVHCDDIVIQDTLLNILKQSLRQTPPDWWFRQPQRQLIVTALDVGDLLTTRAPKAWGDPDDEESALAALGALAQTSQLLVKQLLTTGTKKKSGNDNLHQEAKQDEVVSKKCTKTMKKKTVCTKNTDDQDPTLPLRVIQVFEDATKAAAVVLEQPELSMMGSHDFYRQALRPLAFATVEDAFTQPPHYFAAGNGGSANSRHFVSSYMKKKAPKAKKGKSGNGGTVSSATVLWKELSTYPTALPIEFGSSIFVRTLEDEMDKVRVLILGPDGTPYANGCFLFDVTMGHDYPHLPPKDQFLTTSNFLSASDRKVRFNPNLYDCGKVCLSLLGTWSGPGWSKESTLLQVLISIQSLILGTGDPYFNEPGFDGTQGTPQGKKASLDYNKNIRKQTLRVAILPFLKNQLRHCDDDDDVKIVNPASTSTSPKAYHFEEFADVFKQHFRLKQQVLQKQLFQWYQEDKSLETLYTEYWNVWDQLNQQDQLATGSAAGKRTSAAAKQGATKRAKADAPAVKIKDGVILLDDDDDDNQLNVDSVLAMKISGVQSTGAITASEGGDDVIVLADSDDESNGDRKPAAIHVPRASQKRKARQARKASSGKNSTEERPPVVAAAASSVVDLT